MPISERNRSSAVLLGKNQVAQGRRKGRREEAYNVLLGYDRPENNTTVRGWGRYRTGPEDYTTSYYHPAETFWSTLT